MADDQWLHIKWDNVGAEETDAGSTETHAIIPYNLNQTPAPGAMELPAVREALMRTIDQRSPDLQALYRASGTSVDELLEQKKAIECLASASVINAGVQRQRKGEGQGLKRRRSTGEEEQGFLEADGDDSGSEKQNMSTTNWTENEDKLLYELVARFGTSKWSLVASKFENKTNKQCRRRWQTCSNVLGSKGAWTVEEDKQLIEGHAFFGNRWTDIAKLVPGRTDNAAKNRYFSLLRKQAAAAKGSKPSDNGATGSNSQESELDSSRRASLATPSELLGERRSWLSDDCNTEVDTKVGRDMKVPFFHEAGNQPDLHRLQGVFPQLEPGLCTGRAAPPLSEKLDLNFSDAYSLQQQKVSEFLLQAEEDCKDCFGFPRPRREFPRSLEPLKNLPGIPKAVIPRAPVTADGGLRLTSNGGICLVAPRKRESLDLDLNCAPRK